MKFSINKRVKFLNEKGGGIVIKILNDEMVLVQTEDGFEFPHPIKELIVDTQQNAETLFATTQQNTAITQQPQPLTFEQKIKFDVAEQIKKDNEEINIYIAATLDSFQSPKEVDFHIVNDSNWNVLYSVYFKTEKKYSSIPGSISPNYIEHLKTYSIQDSYKIKEIAVSLLFFRPEPYDIKSPVFKLFTIIPNYFATQKYYISNDFFEQKAILMPILEENPMVQAIESIQINEIDKIKQKKEKENLDLNKGKTYESNKKPDILEIDLHINELLDDTTGMDAKTMIDFQMKKFEEELFSAKKKQYIRKIVFIHGKGNGRLKLEIRNYLERNGYRYQDASFQKYGFGATMVIL
jgi:hypothetical protein